MNGGGDDLTDLEMLTLNSLRRWGLADAESIAAHLIADLRRNMAGSVVYISRGFMARNQQIRREFNGRNAAKLATQYGLSRRHIDRIVRP